MFLNYKKYMLYRKCYGLVCGAYDFEFLWLIFDAAFSGASDLIQVCW